MKASEIQTKILTETGLKTSVKKYSTGSMKGYVRIIPIFQNGSYPSLPFKFVRKLKVELQNFNYENKPLFCSISEISIYGISDEKTQYKNERKPKPADDSKPTKGWGSKNSQMRLDKATSRNAKKMNKGGVARYY